jgi:trehalose utilization protein
VSALNVLIWNEHLDDNRPGPAKDCYPKGIHEAIARGLQSSIPGAIVSTTTLAEDKCGITDAILEAVNVLIWRSHIAHAEVPDDVIDCIQDHVLCGMGLILLHSSAESRVFKRLMGTTCSFRWRDSGERELVWSVDPSHPIAAGLPPVFELQQDETYSEFFDIPQPESVVFISSFAGGEIFRSGCTFRRGDGRIFYFSPGHESYPIYYNAMVRRVIANAVLWADSGQVRRPRRSFLHSPSGWFKAPVPDAVTSD